MAQYLLDCDCGNQVPVDIRQAGGRTTCSCGAQLDVPPLRKLRHLPLAAAEEKPANTLWGARQGLITASLILAAALAAVNLWSWVTQPTVPKFDPETHSNLVDTRLKTWTPAESWLWWIEYYRPLAERGFPIFEAYNRADIEMQIAHRQFLRRTLWIIAAIFAATAATAAFWPQSQKTRRQGDKETRRSRDEA